ncbi:MAG: class I SAM-dependent methyltransferase [Rubrobacter sp.]|nr:class I SAM-dependent methyltransferase [Rubrobacter sp.]
MYKILQRVADNRTDDSLATRLRRRRFALFCHLISSLDRPFSILDVGGTLLFWEKMRFAEERGVRIVLLNVGEAEFGHPKEAEFGHPNFTCVVGDARDMGEFGDQEFEVVFSNSVIEHVGGYDEQRRMAEEVRRVGKRYFLQTPNRFFPIEPHFLFPLFQFLPRSFRVFLVRCLDLGWFKSAHDEQEAAKIVDAIRLLTEREVRALFPEGTVYKEKILGLTKSFVVYSGWGVEMDV